MGPSVAWFYEGQLETTYLLRDNVFTRSIPMQICSGEPHVCLWKNTIRMCNKKRIFGTLMIVW